MGRFRDALAQPGLAGIAEVKRRSPSMGDLRLDADPAAIARGYARAGAAAVSILVDSERFGGSWDDLRAARAVTDVPLLAKGFFTTSEDIATARDAGADAILLLLRDLDNATTKRLMQEAEAAGLDAFVESHDADELERALALEADPIGVNARDLATFDINRARQLDLVATARTKAEQSIIVAESGIWSRAQGAAAELAGADAVLVGSALMKALDPAAKLEELLSRPLVKICGVTREVDVEAASHAGADMVGFILADTPRRAAAVLPVPDTMLSVAVCVGAPPPHNADLLQLHDLEDGHRSRHARLQWKGNTVAQIRDLPWLQDDEEHWQHAAAASRIERTILAGGLDAANVVSAIHIVQPWAVDVARGVESAPGIKDHPLMEDFVQAARTRPKEDQ